MESCKSYSGRNGLKYSAAITERAGAFRRRTLPVATHLCDVKRKYHL